MIRFAFLKGRKAAIGLGISRENVRRLTNGEPIHVSGDSVGVPDIDSIYLFFGETEQIMMEQLAQYIGPDTIVHVDPRLENSR